MDQGQSQSQSPTNTSRHSATTKSRASLTKRLRAIEAALGDKFLQRLILKKCSNDLIYWISEWVWTYDPRLSPSMLPFDQFPRQIEFLEWLEESERIQKGGVAEKSRDVGFTWLCVAFLVHRWLFRSGFSGGVGSRKESLVDEIGNPDSIFEKARIILRHLPKWMLPKGFNWKRHDSFCKLINPANGSTITGEAGDNMGRGGRKSIYFIDESAFIERPLKVDAAISQNTNVPIHVSTANGTGNPFYVKRNGGEWRVFTFSWRDDPRKSEEWYAEQKRLLDPIIIAQEIDIDYKASQEGVIIPRGWLDSCIGRPLYEMERGAIALGVDIAEKGHDSSSVAAREGRNILHVEEWQGHDTEESKDRLIVVGKLLTKRLGKGHRLYFFIDTIGVGSGVANSLSRYINEHNRRCELRQKDPDTGKTLTDADILPWVVVRVHVGESSTDARFKNLKAQLWWRCREWVDEKEPAFSPDIKRADRDKLINQLSVVGYEIGERGLIEIESKRSLKKRGVKSPDMADALVHTFKWEAMKPEPETLYTRYQNANRGDGTWMAH